MRNSYIIRGSHRIDRPISINSDGSIEVQFQDATVPTGRGRNQSLIPTYKLTARPISVGNHGGGQWLTYYGSFNLCPNSSIIDVQATVSYWDKTCPSYMRNEGAPHISGDLVISQIQPTIQATFLWPCVASFEVVAPGFKDMYGPDVEVGHKIWVNGRVIRSQGSYMFLQATVVVPCEDVHTKHWARLGFSGFGVPV
ncbi:hypothetical protein PGTUg99_016990 [Puccinia graminis f. sp. tritici]|uniref:Uncharacterized protein n=1 Tax=Puccinia graminis f. sp. tritici TaxID=56615 RepID=A0A5B0MRB3_PUCGR|nr:hypothetical protein PGTUg99_016990 [Puccinia graminis f. sp. tritici]